jgi:endonuclease/exonuclease/phosphatase family metal-dependent hydrolase
MANLVKMRKFLLLVVAWSVSGSAWAAPLRVVSFNVKDGLGPVGSSGFEAKAQLLERIGADVVALQELQNDFDSQDVTSVAQLQTRLGLPHVHSYPSTSHYVAILSRYPFSNRRQVSGTGMTRVIPLVQIDVPNTLFDPWIAAVHLKAFDGVAEQFRRAVELTRLRNALVGTEASANYQPIVVLGDFNLVSTTPMNFTSDPDGATNGLVTDLPWPIEAPVDANDYFQNPATPIAKLDLRTIDNSTLTHLGGGSIPLDHIMVSAPFYYGVSGSEIYDPVKESLYALGSPRPSRPKFGDPATNSFSYSTYPSDHLPVFADLVLRDPFSEDFPDTNVPTLNLGIGSTGLTFVNRLVTSGVADVTATDDQDPAPVVSCYPLNPTYTSAGTKKITYMARDRMGNIRTMDRTVTVAAWGQGGVTHNLQWPPSMQIPINGQGTVYAQIQIPGWTETVEKVAPNVRCWVGVHTQNTDPSSWPAGVWKEASLNSAQGFGTNADEYMLPLQAGDTGPGVFYYAVRWQINGGSYGYGGVASGGGGGAWDGAVNSAGVLTVGSTIGNWSANAPVTPELVGKYAIGGAANLSAASESPMMEAQTNTLSLTALVRKDDAKLSVEAEWVTDLAGGWSTSGVSSSTNGLSQPTDPGLERRKYIVPYDSESEPRKFLRLKATLQP